MDAEKKVVAETYREKETPPYVRILWAAGLVGLALEVILGVAAECYTLTGRAALLWGLMFSGIGAVTGIAFIAWMLAGWRWHVWKWKVLPCVPPPHTIKVQFMRLLSDLAYLPNDTTKWDSRRVKVRINDDERRAEIEFHGGLLKDRKTLEDDIREKGYMAGVRDANVENASFTDGNGGFLVKLDYMDAEKRAANQDAMDRGEW